MGKHLAMTSDTTPIISGTTPMANGTTTMTNGTTPMTNGTTPMTNGTMPMTNGITCMYHKRDNAYGTWQHLWQMGHTYDKWDNNTCIYMTNVFTDNLAYTKLENSVKIIEHSGKIQ